jgi:hypothetical protein
MLVMTRTLFRRKVRAQLHDAADDGAFAFLEKAQFDRERADRQLFALGVHAQRDRRACAQARVHRFVR